MDYCLPDWNTDIEAERPLLSQRRPFGVDNELVELLWQNGDVVLQSQNNKKLNSDPNKPKQTCGDPNTNPMHDDETVSWIHCPIDDSFDKEFCSKIFSEIPSSANPIPPNNKLPSQFQSQNMFNFGTSNATPNFNANSLPPPRFSSFGGPLEQLNAGGIEEIVDPLKGKGIIRQRSAATIGSSNCGSNQVANDLDLSKAWRDVRDREMHEQPITSSSGGSGSSSMWKTSNQSNDTSRNKRKSWNMEESECKSDGTESESAAGTKSSQKSGTARRSRVAEVHNLSERKRRDRINEKMKALQQLVPNSNKSDKASVLDEAIEYMKSLQLQLQFMWMGRGMAPMMLPGMQQYMARLGLGIGSPTLPQIQDLMRLSRFPPVINPTMRPVTTNPMPNQATFGQNQGSLPVNYQNHMLNPSFQEQYANLMGFGSTQNTSQPMNMFNFGSNPANNHILARPSNGNGYIG